MAFPKKLKELCTPALLYFIISMLGLIFVALLNLGNSNKFNLGFYSANVPNTALVLVVNLIYILFWTWVLNLICKDGHSNISWFLVLVPYVVLLLGFFGIMMTTKEGIISAIGI